MSPTRVQVLPFSRVHGTARRLFFFTLVIATTLAALGLLTSAFLQSGLTPLELVLLILYSLLILWIAVSFWTATLGFWSLLKGDRLTLSALPPRRAAGGEPFKTALVMPVYNEDPERVFAGLRAVYQSLRETAAADDFEIFVLSDTRDPEIWLQEELQWYLMCRDLDAHGKVFYRNRKKNKARKSGNIADFSSAN